MDNIELVAKVIIAIGAISGMYFSYLTNHEIRKDRHLNQKPILIPEQITTVFNYRTVPLNDGKNYYLSENYFGKIINVGNGVALNTKISWLIESVSIDGIKLNKDKVKEIENFNSTKNISNSYPLNIFPKNDSQIAGLPLNIFNNVNGKLQSLKGRFKISYIDSLNNEYRTIQKFDCKLYSKSNTIEIEFGDIIEIGKQLKQL